MALNGVISRPAARIVLLDQRDRILLFRWDVPERDGWPARSWWITPGGGVQEGETHEEAALRELWEETGLLGVPLGPCIWRRNYLFTRRTPHVEQQERYFLARTSAWEVDRANQEEYELTALADHRWWSVAEIAASAEEFVPGELGALLGPVLEGKVPAEPLLVG